MAIAWKAWAFFKRDLLVDLSYKLTFALDAVDIMVSIAAFYFLARLLGAAAFQRYEPFSFILIGLAVNGYMTTSMVCFAQAIKGNQPLGTLKAALATPTSPAAFVLLSSVYPFFRSAVEAGLYLLGGVLLGVPLARVNVPAVLAVFVLSVLAFSSIGILSATFTVVFKRGDPLLLLFGALSWALGGVFYPLNVLPRFLQHAAKLLPITHALEGMRAAMLGAASMADLLPQLAVLGLFGLVGLPLSLLGFCLGVRWAKVTGTLSHF
jgi:ABC-2 type transport system permease protein